MLAVATMALVVNGVSAWLLHDVIHHGHEHGGGSANGHAHGHDAHAHAHGDACAHDHEGDHVHAHDEGSDREVGRGLMVRATHGHALNLRGVWLHLLADALGAVAALVAALIIRFGGSPSADPIASFLVAAILFVGALRLLRDAGLVLLEAAPAHMPLDAIRAIVAESPGVAGVHELHAWTLGAGHDAITVHVRTDSTDPAFAEQLSRRIRRLIGAEYVTVQVETAAGGAEEP
jgi:cation diffusion facilitator family transporter